MTRFEPFGNMAYWLLPLTMKLLHLRESWILSVGMTLSTLQDGEGFEIIRKIHSRSKSRGVNWRYQDTVLVFGKTSAPLNTKELQSFSVAPISLTGVTGIPTRGG